jgi:hypothetical protein
VTANGLRINKTDEWSAAGPEASCRILVDHLGSATSDRFRPGRSDVVLLVEFAGLLGRPVDLVMADAVRNPHFAASVLAGAEELYAA